VTQSKSKAWNKLRT